MKTIFLLFFIFAVLPVLTEAQPYVKCVQRALKKDGFGPKIIDGAIGATTLNAASHWLEVNEADLPELAVDTSDVWCAHMVRTSGILPEKLEVSSKFCKGYDNLFEGVWLQPNGIPILNFRFSSNSDGRGCYARLNAPTNLGVSGVDSQPIRVRRENGLWLSGSASNGLQFDIKTGTSRKTIAGSVTFGILTEPNLGGPEKLEASMETSGPTESQSSEITSQRTPWYRHFTNLVLPEFERAAFRCLQGGLNNRGFKVGKEDGVAGRRTKSALLQYLRFLEFDEQAPDLDGGNAAAFCDLFVDDNPLRFRHDVVQMNFRNGGSIIITDTNAKELASEISALGFLDLLHKVQMISRDEKGIVRPSEKNRAVVYLVWQNLETGDDVSTLWGFRQDPSKSWYTDRYDYTVTDKTATEPLVVVNEYFASVQGEFKFQLILNGELLVERYVPVR